MFFIYFCNYLEVGLLGYNNYEFFMYSGFKPFVRNIYREYSLSERKAMLFSLVLQVMGGEGKAWIGQCCSLWERRQGWMLLLLTPELPKVSSRDSRNQQDRAFGLHIPGLGEWGPIRRSQSVGTGETETRKTGSIGSAKWLRTLNMVPKGWEFTFYKASCSSLLCSPSRLAQGSLHCSEPPRSICPSTCHVGNPDVLGRWERRHLLSWFLTAAVTRYHEHSG